MKPWLKGGLIGLISGIILSAIYFFSVSSCWGLHNCPSEATCGNSWLCDRMTVVITLLGTITGFVIGIIKSKKQKSQKNK